MSSRAERLDRYRGAREQGSPRGSPRAFEALVARALDRLPPYVAERMDNVAVVVEDRPGRVRVSSLGFAEDQELLGLYEGVPKTERAGGYHLVVPDRITLYRLPILQEVGPYASTLAVEDEIRRTIIHEVAHHFGIGDAELDRLEGRQRARR